MPWDVPLEDWVDDRLLEVAHRGISRHVVRFVEADGMVFALKEIDERWPPTAGARKSTTG